MLQRKRRQVWRWVAALTLWALLLCAPVESGATRDQLPELENKGEAVRALQLKLEQLGLYTAPVDDTFGAQTKLGISRAQQLWNQLRPDEPLPEDGRLSGPLYELLMADGLYDPSPIAPGDQGEHVWRAQVRLDLLGYLKGELNATFDEQSQQALRAFQKRNELPQDDRADERCLERLFSSSALPAEYPAFKYRIYINTSGQRTYVFQWNGQRYGSHALSAVCSTGVDSSPTPKGVYRSEGQVSKWCYFPIYGCWAQYAFRVQGPVLLHSVLYRTASESTLDKKSVDMLGKKSSHGCVRLSVEDAQWIYERCKMGTSVVVY